MSASDTCPGLMVYDGFAARELLLAVSAQVVDLQVLAAEKADLVQYITSSEADVTAGLVDANCPACAEVRDRYFHALGELLERVRGLERDLVLMMRHAELAASFAPLARANERTKIINDDDSDSAKEKIDHAN